MPFSFFRAQSPIEAEERAWVHRRMKFLADHFGMDRLRLRRAVEPTNEYFPDPYDGTEAAAHKLLARVCPFMEVAPAQVTLQFYSDDRDQPEHSLEFFDAADSAATPPGTPRPAQCVAIRADAAGDAAMVVSAIAQQLARLRLVSAKLLKPTDEDLCSLVDLATVYFGMGIFTASTAFRFSQWSRERWSGWQAQRNSVLDERTYGYALALWTLIRGEDRPAWSRHLAVNPKTYMKQSVQFIRQNPPAEFTL